MNLKSLFLFVFFCSGNLWAKIPFCSQVLEQNETNYKQILDSDLPNKTLVANNAIISLLAGESSLFKLNHSFVSMKSRFDCSSMPSDRDESWTVLSPVLIDLSSEQSTKNHFWTFNIINSEKRLGSWPRPSHLIKVTSAKEWLKKNVQNISWKMIDSDSYLLSYTFEKGRSKFLVEIVYDVLN